jgi:hypothetical protein
MGRHGIGGPYTRRQRKLMHEHPEKLVSLPPRSAFTA